MVTIAFPAVRKSGQGFRLPPLPAAYQSRSKASSSRRADLDVCQ
jgi:hypothetical protein